MSDMTFWHRIQKPFKNKIVISSGISVIALIFILFYILNIHLISKYKKLESVIIKDRHGDIISIVPNEKQQYSYYIQNLPPRVETLLLKKEDRFFYFHLGINPISIIRAAFRYIFKHNAGGSSTITQQLAKNLLGNEQDRTITNKIDEVLYTASLELFHSKAEILTMYVNTVYMGNQFQGLQEASITYFGKNLSDLNDSELVMLLTTISSPSTQNPWRGENKNQAALLAKRLDVAFDNSQKALSSSNFQHISDSYFEFKTLHQTCPVTCITTLDKDLTEHLRTILKKNIDQVYDTGAHNGAIVVIKEPENEVLAMVGSPNPNASIDGNSINMAIQPRPIGSTAKPFIYLTAFEKGLRPYTLVDDREYKFPIASGFPLYPKNYDGTYRGLVTLHEALSNSLNVPTVKTLEFVGLPDFYYFLEQKLGFSPLQDLDKYQYGIALGGLEMDPLTLAYNFSIFPNQGVLKPLTLFAEHDTLPLTVRPPMSRLINQQQIADPKYIGLVSKILNDRKTGVEQFGLASSLNLSQDNYAVKTGTSRDYHDSWTVGYTPDFIVAVWLGNAENKPLEHVSGQSGAGRVWNESMQLLMNSEYNKKTPLAFPHVKDILINNSLDSGLDDDIVAEHRNILEDKTLILSPHADDSILLEPTTVIPLKSSRTADWYANDVYLGHNTHINFTPTHVGTYILKAQGLDGKIETETINIVRQ